jgi:hypothetical protein
MPFFILSEAQNHGNFSSIEHARSASFARTDFPQVISVVNKIGIWSFLTQQFGSSFECRILFLGT